MIENELKYVLNLDGEYQWNSNGVEIIQAYLCERGRIRKTILDPVVNGEAAYVNDLVRCEFTYKVAVGDALEELTVKITADEFDRLYAVSTTRLTKIRHTLEYGNEKWDVDFFYTDDRLYFVMAECEMPEGQGVPILIPDFISNNLHFAVPRERTPEFASYRICDAEYAETMYNRC